MPAVSKAQQRFMGMVYAVKKGEMSAPSSEVAKAAASMSKKDAKDFASTKHKKLPEKVVAKEESNPRIPRKKGQPANSKKHSDLYTDENPKGTIHGLGFKDVATAKASVSKIRNSSRSHAHKIQAAVAMEQRAREMGKTSEAAVYRKFINTMKEKTKKMNEGWSDKYKKSIDCNNPKGFSQRAHCQGKKKVAKEAYYGGEEQRKKDERKAKYEKQLKKMLPKRAFDSMGRELDPRSGKLKESKYDKYDKEKKEFAKSDRKMKFGKFYDRAKQSKLRPGEVKRYDKELGRYVSNKE